MLSFIYAESHIQALYAECHKLFMPSVIKLNVVMLSAFMMNVVMLSVVAPGPACLGCAGY